MSDVALLLNCSSSDLNTTLGVLSYHRSLMRELTAKGCAVYIVHNSDDHSETVREAWAFAKGIISTRQAQRLAAEKGQMQWIEISAHQFQPPELGVKSIGFVFDLHIFDIPWKYSANLRERFLRVVRESTAVVTMFPRTYYDLESVVGRPLNNLYLLESPLLFVPEYSGERRANRSSRKAFLYPAQFQPHKNHIGLVSGLAAFVRSGGDAELVFTGSDFANEKRPLRLRILEHAERVGVRERVLIPGHVNDASLASLYSQVDGLIVPSLAEGGAYVPLEGIYAGLPVAVHRLRAAEMHLQMFGASVIWFDSTEQESVAQALAKLCAANRAEWAEANSSARDELVGRSWSRVADATLRIAEWCLLRAPRPILSLAPGHANICLT